MKQHTIKIVYRNAVQNREDREEGAPHPEGFTYFVVSYSAGRGEISIKELKPTNSAQMRY